MGPTDEACLTERSSTLEGCDSSLYTVRSGTSSATFLIAECPTAHCVFLLAPVVGGVCTPHDPYVAGGAVCYESKRVWVISNGNGPEVADYENVTICHGVISTESPAYACAGSVTYGEAYSSTLNVACVGVVANPGNCAGQSGDVFFLRVSNGLVGTPVNQRVACST